MANVAIATSNEKSSLAQNMFIIKGILSFNSNTANYVQGVGATWNFAQSSANAGVATGKVPHAVFIESANVGGISSSNGSTYGYHFVPGTPGNNQNCAVQIFSNGNLATEAATAAVPTAVFNDKLKFTAFVDR